MSDSVGIEERIQIRDRRSGYTYSIHNAVYDMGPSCEALAMYNALCRYANSRDERAYFSAKKWKTHHKVGFRKYNAAKQWLIENGLIRDTGMKNEAGAQIYELLERPDFYRYQSEPAKKVSQGETGVSHGETGGVSQGETGGSLTSREGGVSRRETNNSNKQHKKQHKKSPEGDTPKKPRPTTEEMDKVIVEMCKYILEYTGQKLDPTDKYFKIWVYNAERVDGLDNLKIAVRNFCHDKFNKSIGVWDWFSFFRYQAKRVNFLPKTKTVKKDTAQTQLSAEVHEELSTMDVRG